MDTKDFFGAPDDDDEQLAKPSILSVVVAQCVLDLAGTYKALPDGLFEVSRDDDMPYILSEADVTADICSWVKELKGGDPIGNKIVSLVRGNTGWEKIIAKRTVRELRKWA